MKIINLYLFDNDAFQEKNSLNGFFIERARIEYRFALPFVKME